MTRFTRRRRQKNSRLLSEISLTPLIDTALTLLIIFMVATPMIHNAVKVSLPKGQLKEQGSSKQDLIVTVNDEGTLFLNDAKINKDELITHVQNSIGDQQDKIVLVRAYKNASYGSVVELMDSLKGVGGVKHIALATVHNA